MIRRATRRLRAWWQRQLDEMAAHGEMVDRMELREGIMWQFEEDAKRLAEDSMRISIAPYGIVPSPAETPLPRTGKMIVGGRIVDLDAYYRR